MVVAQGVVYAGVAMQNQRLYTFYGRGNTGLALRRLIVVALVVVLLVGADDELMASLDWDLFGQLSKTVRPEIASDPHPRRPGSDQYGSLGLSR